MKHSIQKRVAATAQKIHRTADPTQTQKIIPTLQIAQKMVAQAVTIYNNERRHCSLQMNTPAFAHKHQKHEYKSYKKLVA